MSDGAATRMRGIYRSATHLPIWAVLRDAGIWDRVGLELTQFDYVDDSSIAEHLLLSGEIDFISGNHISTYTQFFEGQPIVHLTSPSNSVHDTVATREPISSVAELRGKRLGETMQISPTGGYAHNRGNHVLYLMRDGVQPTEVEWVELAPKMSDDFRRKQLEAMQDGRIDATFVTGDTQEYEEAGFSLFHPERLPMINGPTITCSSATLRRRPELADRLVKAQILGIHFANAHTDQTNEILARLARDEAEVRGATADRITRFPRKPYPELPAVANAYELACLQTPETRQVSPLALWNLHYLRELDDSGFIDNLYAA